MNRFISCLEVSREQFFSLAEQAELLSKTLQPVPEGEIGRLAFFDPSTRTRVACDAAVKGLGGDCLNLGDRNLERK
jgi:aspartate carbamoyltransferase catalytic subunit